MSAFGRVEDIGPQRIWGGVVARAIEAERITLCTVELDPDIVVPEHRHENEQVGMLVKGSMR